MISPVSQSDELFCKAVLTEQADALLKELVALQIHSTEKLIHDTRVQSRRMRAALEAFQDLFDPGPYRTVYATIKKITRILGKCRETQVVRDLLRTLSDAGDMAEGICREYLNERIESRLRKQERRLQRNLKEIDSPRLQSQIQILLAGVESQTEESKRGMGKPFQTMLFQMNEGNRQRALRLFRELELPILSFRPRYQFHRATEDALHELRIAAKKLRYAMELFSPLWARGLADKIKDARGLQTAGGKFHDWCVLCEILKAELRHVHAGDNAHLVFQIGRLLSFAEDRKTELRKKILPAINTLQASLQQMPADLRLEREPEKPEEIPERVRQ
jgi:CHAD domain-containing protein